MNPWNNVFGGKPIEKTPAPSAIPPTEAGSPGAAPSTNEALGAHFGDAAEAATTALGRRLQDVARRIHDRSGGLVGSLALRHVPGGAVLGVASNAVASGLERGGKFLESEGFQGTVKGLSEQMKRNPIPFLMVGIGLGFLAGRRTRSTRT